MFGDQAHGLKSGISMIGCRRLGLLCYKIELYVKTFDFLIDKMSPLTPRHTPRDDKVWFLTHPFKAGLAIPMDVKNVRLAFACTAFVFFLF